MKKFIFLIIILSIFIASYSVWQKKYTQQKLAQEVSELALDQQHLRAVNFQNTQFKLQKTHIPALFFSLTEVNERRWSEIEAELPRRINKFCFEQQHYSAQVFNMRRDHDNMQKDLAHFKAIFRAPHREASPYDHVLLTLIEDNIVDAYTYPIQTDNEQHILANFAFSDQKNTDCKAHLSQAILNYKP